MTEAAKFECIPTVPKLQVKCILCSSCSFPAPSDAVPLLQMIDHLISGQPLYNAGMPFGALLSCAQNAGGGCGPSEKHPLTTKPGLCQLQLSPAPANHTIAHHCLLAALHALSQEQPVLGAVFRQGLLLLLITHHAEARCGFMQGFQGRLSGTPQVSWQP